MVIVTVFPVTLSQHPVVDYFPLTAWLEVIFITASENVKSPKFCVIYVHFLVYIFRSDIWCSF